MGASAGARGGQRGGRNVGPGEVWAHTGAVGACQRPNFISLGSDVRAPCIGGSASAAGICGRMGSTPGVRARGYYSLRGMPGWTKERREERARQDPGALRSVWDIFEDIRESGGGTSLPGACGWALSELPQPANDPAEYPSTPSFRCWTKALGLLEHGCVLSMVCDDIDDRWRFFFRSARVEDAQSWTRGAILLGARGDVGGPEEGAWRMRCGDGVTNWAVWESIYKRRHLSLFGLCTFHKRPPDPFLFFPTSN